MNKAINYIWLRAPKELRAVMLVLGVAANTDEALLPLPQLTSCSAALFLTGYQQVPVYGPGVGDL